MKVIRFALGSVVLLALSASASIGILVGSVSTGVATLRLSTTTVTGNGTGLHDLGSPALLLSRGDNTIEGNTTDTSGTIGSYSGR